MKHDNVFNDRPTHLHGRQFSETIYDQEQHSTLYEDDEARIELQAQKPPVTIWQHLRHFPGWPKKHLVQLEDILSDIDGSGAQIEQTTRYALDRDFGNRKSHHEFTPRTDRTYTTDPAKDVLEATDFDVLSLRGDSIWETYVYNTFKKASFLAATQFSLIEHHKNTDKPINPGKRTILTYTRYLNITPR